MVAELRQEPGGGGGAAKKSNNNNKNSNIVINGPTKPLRLGLILALTLLLLPGPPLSGGPATTGTGGRPSLGRSIIFGHVQLAAASYLEDAGRLSRMLNQLIDQLLEKVSFLADLIIESSLEEQCAAVKCEAGSSPTQSTSNASTDDPLIHPKILEAHRLDHLEYENSHKYIKQFRERMERMLQNRGSAEIDDNGEPSMVSNHCKLFNLPIGKSELPVSNMESCCKEYNSCYSRCGISKLFCDDQFRVCLGLVCKEKFDYTNESLVIRHARYVRSGQSSEGGEELSEEGDELLEDLEDDVTDSDTGQFSKNGAAIEHQQRRDKRASITMNEPGLETEEDKRPSGSEIISDTTSDANESSSSTGKSVTADEVGEREKKQVKDKYKACKLANKVLLIGNLAFGCHAYKQAQWLACCSPALKQKLESKDSGMTTRDSGPPPPPPSTTVPNPTSPAAPIARPMEQ